MSTHTDAARMSSFGGEERDANPGRVTRVRSAVDAPPLSTSEIEPELVAEHQQNMPEGEGAIIEERKLLPWVMAGLATFVLVAGALMIGLRFGWIAAGMGIIWLLMGFAVSWSVVWGAGLLRARDEQIVEKKVERGQVPPPPGRVG